MAMQVRKSLDVVGEHPSSINGCPCRVMDVHVECVIEYQWMSMSSVSREYKWMSMLGEGVVVLWRCMF